MTEAPEDIVRNNLEQFNKAYKEPPSFTAIAPGRINVIGEHTDYNEGLAMPAAINRWVAASFSPRNDREINIKSIDFNSRLSFKIGEVPAVTESWQKYVFGAISVFNNAFPILNGFNACIRGNVPIQSGVSSSAAIEVAMMNGLRRLYHAGFNDFALIKLCQNIEHEYLKVKSGLLDQYASQFSKKGKIMVLDFKTLEHQYINAQMNNWTWVLVDSKVKRELAKSKYTERVNETRMAFNYLLKAGIKLHHFREIREEHLEIIENDIWKKRLRHYITENERVLKSITHLEAGNFKALGNELTASHHSLQNDYEVSCKELDFLVKNAVKFKDCCGSRMMGGGFGGCTINLVKKEAVSQFSDYISGYYYAGFNIIPGVNKYALVDGAKIYS